ncbi:MAG: O-antigen ligase family protein [Bacteroidota bacterium]|nr:O-antigen ligase family protein [Bacteroidota bacterium]
MSITVPAALNPIRLQRWGMILLMAGLGLGLAITLALTNTGSLIYVTALPALILGSLLIGVLFWNSTLNLVVAIAGFVVMANNVEGFQLVEILYAAYLYALLGLWFVRYRLLDKQPIVTSRADGALTVFLALLPVTLVLTFTFNGDFRVAASELISLSMLLIYYPVRHTVATHRTGPRIILLTVVTLGALVAMVNLIEYAGDLSNAWAAVQIAGSRVVVNDCLLLTGALASLTLLVYARKVWVASLYLGAFALTFAGLIVTQTRGYWLAFILGFAALLYLMNARQRARTLIGCAVAGGIIFGIAYVMIGPFLFVVAGGIIERFGSLGTALTQDLSLINRFRESWAVLRHIAWNPLIGYGPGVPYEFWDIVHQTTHIDTYVHNGYIGLWYKYGLWGLIAVMYFWLSTARRGIGAFRTQSADLWTRLAGISGALPMIAVLVATLTANPFYLKNYLFIIGVSAGMAAGAAARVDSARK